MHLRTCLAMALALASGAAATAQLGTADTTRWQLGLVAQTSWVAGNVNRLLLTGEGSVVFLDSTWGFGSRNRYQYGTFGPRLTENDLLSRNFVYLFPHSRVYPYAMLWAESRQMTLLAQRLQAGAGATWVAVRQPRHSLRFSLSLTHEAARYAHSGFAQPEYAGRRQVQLQRATLRLAGAHTLGPLRLGYEAWWQPAPAHWPNHRARAEAWLAAPLARRLSLQGTYVYQYEWLHLAGIRPQDHLLLVGLAWRLATQTHLLGL